MPPALLVELGRKARPHRGREEAFETARSRGVLRCVAGWTSSIDRTRWPFARHLEFSKGVAKLIRRLLERVMQDLEQAIRERAYRPWLKEG
jgi:hypothetical protein